VGAVIRIIRATCIEEGLHGGHGGAVEHGGEGLSLLGHAVSTPNVLAFSKSILIVAGVYRIWVQAAVPHCGVVEGMLGNTL
jgi:hypothetical protein